MDVRKLLFVILLVVINTPSFCQSRFSLLKDLATQRASGVITQNEYNQKRNELLKSMPSVNNASQESNQETNEGKSHSLPEVFDKERFDSAYDQKMYEDNIRVNNYACAKTWLKKGAVDVGTQNVYVSKTFEIEKGKNYFETIRKSDNTVFLITERDGELFQLVTALFENRKQQFNEQQFAKLLVGKASVPKENSTGARQKEQRNVENISYSAYPQDQRSTAGRNYAGHVYPNTSLQDTDKYPTSNQSANTYNVGNNSYTNFGDGTTANTYSVGNHTYTNFSNGNTATSYKVGNQVHTNFSDGTTANTYSVGNQVYTNFSDGTTANTYSVGNHTYTNFSDGTTATSYKVGNQTYTNVNKK